MKPAASDYPHKLEFVCSQCLASVSSKDDDPVPRCARCLICMTPDADVNPARSLDGCPAGNGPARAQGGACPHDPLAMGVRYPPRHCLAGSGTLGGNAVWDL